MNNEALISAYQETKDKAVLLELWNQNKPLIRQTIRRIIPPQDQEDGFQEAFLALIMASEGYRPESGVPFIGYLLTAIRRRLTRELLSAGLPTDQASRVYRYHRFIDSFYLQHGREPSDQELREGLCLTQRELDDCRAAAAYQTALALNKETETEDGDQLELMDVIPGEASADQDILDEESALTILQAIREELSDQEAQAIALRADGNTFLQIAEACGYDSPGKAQRSYNKATRQLRRSSRFCDCLPSSVYRGSISAFNRTWTSATEREALRRTPGGT